MLQDSLHGVWCVCTCTALIVSFPGLMHRSTCLSGSVLRWMTKKCVFHKIYITCMSFFNRLRMALRGFVHVKCLKSGRTRGQCSGLFVAAKTVASRT